MNFDERRVWWSYLGRTYPECLRAGFFWAPGETDHPITQVQPGDQVVHEYLRKVVAISRVLSLPEPLTASELRHPLGEKAGYWRVQACFEELPQAVAFTDFRDALLAVEPETGPMHQALGSGKPGDLYPFNWAALELVLEATQRELL